jgi:hypothetical protein
MSFLLREAAVVGDVLYFDAAEQHSDAIEQRGGRRTNRLQGGRSVVSEIKREAHGFPAQKRVRGISEGKA